MGTQHLVNNTITTVSFHPIQKSVQGNKAFDYDSLKTLRIIKPVFIQNQTNIMYKYLQALSKMPGMHFVWCLDV